MELKRRKVARILLLNDNDEVLLVRHVEGKAIPNPDDGWKTYWVPPGGGLEPNETFEEAAVRELKEETGIAIEKVERHLLSREFESIYAGKPIWQEDRFFFARISDKPLETQPIIDEAIGDIKWWPVASINSSNGSFFPANIPELLKDELGKNSMSKSLPIRKCARAIVVNDLNEVLMIKHKDTIPANPLTPDILEYWVPPGGGVDEHESFVEAAIRELSEETGIELQNMQSLILERSVDLHYRNELVTQREQFFLSRISGTPAIPFFDSNEGIVDARWWPLEEIKKSEEIFFPAGLYTLLKNVLTF